MPSTRTADTQDPRWLPVQVQVRMPFWYRNQLTKLAVKGNVSLNTLVMDAIERTYKPAPPTTPLPEDAA